MKDYRDDQNNIDQAREAVIDRYENHEFETTGDLMIEALGEDNEGAQRLFELSEKSRNAIRDSEMAALVDKMVSNHLKTLVAHELDVNPENYHHGDAA